MYMRTCNRAGCDGHRQTPLRCSCGDTHTCTLKLPRLGLHLERGVSFSCNNTSVILHAIVKQRATSFR